MMPDLGKYAVEVGAAYGVGLGLLLALVLLSLRRARKTQHRLNIAEDRKRKGRP